MKSLKEMEDSELLRELFKRGLSVNRVNQLRDMHYGSEALKGLSDTFTMSASAAREEALSRMQSRAPSREWDGVGPKRDCLLLIRWDSPQDGNGWRWVQFEWRDSDEDRHEGYSCDELDMCAGLDSDRGSSTYGRYVECHGFTILRWSDLPEVGS